MTPKGMYFIDGIDLWQTFGIGVEDGSDDLLKIPEAKDRTSHDWLDESGIDIDLSRTFLKPREVSLKCFIISNSESDFWTKFNQFIQLLIKPELRRLSITEHDKNYYVYYQDNNIYERFTRIKNSSKIACKFTLTLVEKNPAFSNGQTFLVDEDNRFIIT